MKSFILGWVVLIAAFSKYDYEYIEMVNLERKPIIEATLNGKTAYFLVDSGSDITMLNKDGRKKYDFRLLSRRGETHNVAGLGGTTSDFTATYRVKLELGSTRIFTRYLAYDLSSIVQSIHRSTGIEIAGVIGSDILKRYGVIIDYKNKQIGIRTKGAKEV